MTDLDYVYLHDGSVLGRITGWTTRGGDLVPLIDTTDRNPAEVPPTPSVVRIPLTRGMVALIDEADAELVSRFTWYAHQSRSGWYARGAQTTHAHGAPHVRMHRLILGAGPGQQVDHRNGDTLDNRRSNLRLANASQQQANRPAKNGIKGVLRTDAGTFHARIRVHGRTIHLGAFQTPEAAARAYDAAAIDAFGEFASLNFPPADLSAGRSSDPASPHAGEPDGRSTEVPAGDATPRTRGVEPATTPDLAHGAVGGRPLGDPGPVVMSGGTRPHP